MFSAGYNYVLKCTKSCIVKFRLYVCFRDTIDYNFITASI